MAIPKTSKHVFSKKWLCFILAVLTFQILWSNSGMISSSQWFNYTNDVGTQYVQFAQPPIPSYPRGSGFARGSIDLGGGLRVHEAQYFTKIWTIYEGGYDDFGTSFYEPALLPKGFHLLGHFSQPNSKPISASVIIAQDTTGNPNNPALAKPIAYALLWTSEGLNISKDGEGYIWLPIPPNGYKPVGQVVTKSRDMPSVDLVRVVRKDLTSKLQVDRRVWGNGQFNIYTTKPVNRWVNSSSVPVGTFMAIDGPTHLFALACLKRAQPIKSSMPNIRQVRAIVEAYSPVVYFHPNEEYLPSSVEWFFANRALLYRKGQSSGEHISIYGWNLPVKGSINDSNMDLPHDIIARERVKRGDLKDAKAYVHVKPALGGTYTDLAIWLYYPFNGPGMFQFGPVNIKFKRVGEHVSDWEHLTLRVDNFHGGLKRIYLSQHSKGTWVNSMEFDYEAGKPVVYSSLHGHALYTGEGQFINGKRMAWKEQCILEKIFVIGVRDDTGKGKKMDIRRRYEVLQSDPNTLLRQQWLYYPARWGPKIKYNRVQLQLKVNSSTKWLPKKLKYKARKALRHLLPAELFGEKGPLGPIMKDSWAGDETV